MTYIGDPKNYRDYNRNVKSLKVKGSIGDNINSKKLHILKISITIGTTYGRVSSNCLELQRGQEI